jgi:hypothetical protein
VSASISFNSVNFDAGIAGESWELGCYNLLDLNLSRPPKPLIEAGLLLLCCSQGLLLLWREEVFEVGVNLAFILYLAFILLFISLSFVQEHPR